MYVPPLLYLFLCLWTFRLPPCLGSCERCCNEHWGACILSDHVFLWIYAGSYGSSIFSFSKNSMRLISSSWKITWAIWEPGLKTSFSGMVGIWNGTRPSFIRHSVLFMLKSGPWVNLEQQMKMNCIPAFNNHPESRFQRSQAWVIIGFLGT